MANELPIGETDTMRVGLRELALHLNKAKRADHLADALRAMLRRDERNTCQHEDTHRGGYLWTICDACGAKWADDRGGKPEWQDPQEWTDARAALSAYEGKDNG